MMENNRINVIRNNKSEIIERIGTDHLIEIKHTGYTLKGMNKYRIQIWKEECGTIYNKMKCFKTITDAEDYTINELIK